jgi:large conductance mechanosensitive channel
MMIKEFKDFIMKGDVLSLAVAVIIGAAFGAIVASLVADIITPIIGAILGGVDLAGQVIKVGDAAIGWGNFVQAIINFLIVAFVMFMVIKAYNRANPPVPPAPATDPADVVLLKQIRDLLANRR